MGKRILVTGGTGFIGDALVRSMVMRGDNVRTLDNGWRTSTNQAREWSGSVERITGDIRDADAVTSAMKGIDSVCHLAAINGTANFYERPELVLEVGVKGILNVLDGAKANGVSDIFVMSTSEVYQLPNRVPTDETAMLVVPDPLNPRYSYGASKIISEMLALHASTGRRTCVVRPHNVYGPSMGFDHVIPQFIERILSLVARGTKNAPGSALRFRVQGDGSETRSFCFIEDFVDGFLRVFDKGENRGIYHIGTTEETAIADLARLIADHFAHTLELVPSALTKGSTPRRCPDIMKIRRLGYNPRWDLKSGLRKTIHWYESNPSRARSVHETAQT